MPGTDERGAQLSQECPPPVGDPMGTRGREAQCHCDGRVFQLGPDFLSK
jgi:hypothetical protein